MLYLFVDFGLEIIHMTSSCMIIYCWMLHTLSFNAPHELLCTLYLRLQIFLCYPLMSIKQSTESCKCICRADFTFSLINVQP